MEDCPQSREYVYIARHEELGPSASPRSSFLQPLSTTTVPPHCHFRGRQKVSWKETDLVLYNESSM